MEATITIKRLASIASDSSVRLRTLFSSLWRVLTVGADKILLPEECFCISIEKDAFSVAYGTRFLTRIKINAFRKHPLKHGGYPQPEELASAVPLAVSELKTVNAEVILNVPKKWVVIKKVELPITAKENLQGVISYEMDRLTPFSSEEAFYDFRILKEDEKKITILLVAAKTDLVNKYIDLLREKGIYVSRVSVNLSGIGSLSHYMDKNGDSIFVEIDKNEYEGALFTDGSIVSVFAGNFYKDRKIPPSPTLLKGGEGGLEVDDSSRVETILKEIAPFIETAKKERRKIQLLISLKNTGASFKEMLRQRTDLPLKVFEESDIKLRTPQGQKAFPYAAIGGVLEGLWQKQRGLNLLTKGVRERQKTPLFLTTILLLIIVVLWVVYTIMPLKIEEKRLSNVDREIAIRKGDIKKFEWLTKEIEDVQKEISDIRSFKENRPMTLDILKELTTILPENAWLTRMHISGNMVEIEGYAGSATGLLQKFEASRYFEKVELASPAFKDIKKGVDRFSIRMDIEGAKEMKATVKGQEEGIVDEGL